MDRKISSKEKEREGKRKKEREKVRQNKSKTEQMEATNKYKFGALVYSSEVSSQVIEDLIGRVGI